MLGNGRPRRLETYYRRRGLRQRWTGTPSAPGSGAGVRLVSDWDHSARLSFVQPLQSRIHPDKPGCNTQRHMLLASCVLLAPPVSARWPSVVVLPLVGSLAKRPLCGECKASPTRRWRSVSRDERLLQSRPASVLSKSQKKEVTICLLFACLSASWWNFCFAPAASTAALQLRPRQRERTHPPQAQKGRRRRLPPPKSSSPANGRRRASRSPSSRADGIFAAKAGVTDVGRNEPPAVPAD